METGAFDGMPRTRLYEATARRPGPAPKPKRCQPTGALYSAACARMLHRARLHAGAPRLHSLYVLRMLHCTRTPLKSPYNQRHSHHVNLPSPFHYHPQTDTTTTAPAPKTAAPPGARTHDLMPAYYRQFFPYEEFMAWLAYGNGEEKHGREFRCVAPSYLFCPIIHPTPLSLSSPRLQAPARRPVLPAATRAVLHAGRRYLRAVPFFQGAHEIMVRRSLSLGMHFNLLSHPSLSNQISLSLNS